MRIFSSASDAINEITRDVFARGFRSFDATVQGKLVEPDEWEMKELLGYSFMITDWLDRDEMFEFAQKNFIYPDHEPPTVKWAEAWFQERIGAPSNPGESWKLRPKYWRPFMSLGRFSYTYQERIFTPQNISQIDVVAKALKKNLHMRGAIVAIWDPNRDIPLIGKERVPCSMYYQFLYRPYLGKEKLYVLYNIRSQDLVNHLPSDIYCATRMCELISAKVGVEPGPLIEFAGSLHAYRRYVKPDRRW